MRGLSALALVSLLWVVFPLVGGCGDDGPAGPGRVEGISFTFSGDTSGTYVAGGSMRVDSTGVPEFGNWAIQAQPDSLGGLVIASFRPTADPKGDLFVLQLDQRRLGPSTPCEPNGACHGRVFFGFHAAQFDDYFEIVSGTITIDELGNGRLKGTFQFTARDQGGTGTRTLVVNDGVFDVPVGDAAQSRAVRCAIAGGAC